MIRSPFAERTLHGALSSSEAFASDRRDVLIDSGIDIDIDIGIAIEIDIGSIGEDLDNDPDPDPDFDFDGLDRAALQILDASVRCRPLKDLEVRQRSVRYAASKGA
jgi:hypothetical protein